jgi:hypothetical protein
MRITITRNYQDVEVELYDFQFWNRRLFCKGNINGEICQFISTEGFENLLIKIKEDGEYVFNPNQDIKYEFELNKKFNPYTSDYIPVKEELLGNKNRSYFKRLLLKEYTNTYRKPNKNKSELKIKKIKRITYNKYDVNSGKIIKRRKTVKLTNANRDEAITVWKRVNIKTDIMIETKTFKPFYDIGPKDFTGNYKLVYHIGRVIDNLFFETVDFVRPEFDLWQYQTVSEYRSLHYSNGNEKEPKLIMDNQKSLFNYETPSKIIHAVRKTQNDRNEIIVEDFFNTNILIDIFNNDSPPPGRSTSTFRNVLNTVHGGSVCYDHIDMIIEFISYDKYLKKIVDDNDKWIRALYGGMRKNRKYELRHFYEYKRFIAPWLAHVRRRTLDPEFEAGARGALWSHKFVLHSEVVAGVYNLVYYQNNSIDNELQKVLLVESRINADPLFRIELHYDTCENRLVIDGYNNKHQLCEILKNYVSLSNLIIMQGILTGLNKQGKIELDISKSKNSLDKLRLYINSSTLVNLYDILEVFGQCSGRVRSNLKKEYVYTKDLKEIYDFEFYSIPQAPTSELVMLEVNSNPIKLDRIAIDVMQAIDFIVQIEKMEFTTDNQSNNMMQHGLDSRRRDKMVDRAVKSKLWYASANKLIMFASMPHSDNYIPTFNEWRRK